MSFKNIIFNLIRITPFKIGSIITLICAAICINYYNIHPDEIEYYPLYGTLNLIHNKTVDFKMRQRPPREISNEIVLVTVDEESLEKIGRWVWPRNIFAEMIDTLSKSNASTIALDVIFAEPEKVPSFEWLNKIQKITNDPKVKEIVNDSLIELDNDVKLKNAILNNKDKVILGTYFTDELYRPQAYQDLCFNIIYQRTKDYKIMEKYEFPIGVLDTTLSEEKLIYTELPTSIQKFINQYFDILEKELQNKSKNLHPLEIRKESRNKKNEFCNEFLKSEKNISLFKKNWDIFQKQSEEISSLTFDDWLLKVRNYNLRNPIHGASDFTTNIESISNSSSTAAYFRAFLDSDGVIRKAKLIARYGDKIIPSMALAAFLQHKQLNIMIEIQENPDSFTTPSRSGSKVISNFSFFSNETGEVVQKFPIDQYSKIQINYAGKRNTFPYISASEILNDSNQIKVYQNVFENEQWTEKTFIVDRNDFLKNKIILIGATATGIYDLRVVPIDNDFPGLEVHANILDNLLQNNMLRPVYLSKELLFGSDSNENSTVYSESFFMPILIIFVGTIISFLVSYFGALWGFLSVFIFIISSLLLDYYALFLNNYIISIIFPIFLVLIIYVSLTFYKYLTEEQTKKELKGTFQKYVSPSIVNEILSDPGKIELGGRKQHMTVLFSDVRGFTTFAEKLDPKILGDFLNSYLTPMTRIIFKNNGTLDKYIGDAIMAFFGAPIAYKDHALKCCFSAIEMVNKLKDLNNEYKKKGLPEIDIGVGINTGEMSVGNMGSDIVRSYTVMGDSVNLASRLEGISKTYGTRIIISETTYEEVKNSLKARALDLVRVKGKSQPVKIYDLIYDESKNYETYSLAYESYLNKEFDKALNLFNKQLHLTPNDGPSLLYIQRCQDYIHNPPSENWDGVYEFKTK